MYLTFWKDMNLSRRLCAIKRKTTGGKVLSKQFQSLGTNAFFQQLYGT